MRVTDLELVDGVYVPEPDVHVKTAMEMFSCTAKQVTSDMRKRAKIQNFNVIYGGSRSDVERALRERLCPKL